MKTYSIEFFHGQEGCWKRSTMQTFTAYRDAKKNLDAHIKMCHGTVEFRIVEIQQLAQ